jgi:hypothetical protein
LEAVGIEGWVAFEFVIDTTGKVESVSIRVLESTHEAFVAAGRTALTGAIFRPPACAAIPFGS